MVQEAEVNPVVLVEVAKEHQGSRDTELAAVCEREWWLNEWEMHLHCNSGSDEQQQELFATSFCQHLFVSDFMKMEKNLIEFCFFLALKFCTIVSVILAAKMIPECFTFFFQVFELSCSIEVCHINLLLAKLNLYIISLLLFISFSLKLQLLES